MSTTPSLPRFFEAAAPHRMAVLKALWPVIAGDAMANHSEAVGIQGDVLRIRVDSAAWLKTIRDLRTKLIFRLQQAAGPLAPRGLAFVEGPVSPRRVRRRREPPLSPEPIEALPESIRAHAEDIPTPEGREAFLRAVAAFKARYNKKKA